MKEGKEESAYWTNKPTWWCTWPSWMEHVTVNTVFLGPEIAENMDSNILRNPPMEKIESERRMQVNGYSFIISMVRISKQLIIHEIITRAIAS